MGQGEQVVSKVMRKLNAVSSTDENERGGAIREAAHYPSTATSLPVETLNHNVRVDSCPVLRDWSIYNPIEGRIGL